MNVGAQKCVIQRVRKIEGVLVCGSVGSRYSRSEKKSRTWSSAMRIMTAPRTKSMESTRSGRAKSAAAELELVTKDCLSGFGVGLPPCRRDGSPRQLDVQ